jgi:hypothetical protein
MAKKPASPHKTLPTPASPRLLEKTGTFIPLLQRDLQITIENSGGDYILSRGTAAARRTGMAMLRHIERGISSREQTAAHEAIVADLEKRRHALAFDTEAPRAAELVYQVAQAAADKTQGNIHERRMAAAIWRQANELQRQLKGDQPPATLADWQRLLTASLRAVPGPGLLSSSQEAYRYHTLICATFGSILTHRNHVAGQAKSHEREQKAKKDKDKEECLVTDEMRLAAREKIAAAIAHTGRVKGPQALSRFSGEIGKRLRNLQQQVADPEQVRKASDLRYALAHFTEEFPDHALLPEKGREAFCLRTVQTFGRLQRARNGVKRKRAEIARAGKLEDAAHIEAAAAIAGHFNAAERSAMAQLAENAAAEQGLQPSEKQALAATALLAAHKAAPDAAAISAKTAQLLKEEQRSEQAIIAIPTSQDGHIADLPATRLVAKLFDPRNPLATDIGRLTGTVLVARYPRRGAPKSYTPVEIIGRDPDKAAMAGKLLQRTLEALRQREQEALQAVIYEAPKWLPPVPDLLERDALEEPLTQSFSQLVRSLPKTARPEHLKSVGRVLQKLSKGTAPEFLAEAGHCLAQLRAAGARHEAETEIAGMLDGVRQLDAAQAKKDRRDADHATAHYRDVAKGYFPPGERTALEQTVIKRLGAKGFPAARGALALQPAAEKMRTATLDRSEIPALLESLLPQQPLPQQKPRVRAKPTLQEERPAVQTIVRPLFPEVPCSLEGHGVLDKDNRLEGYAIDDYRTKAAHQLVELSYDNRHRAYRLDYAVVTPQTHRSDELGDLMRADMPRSMHTHDRYRDCATTDRREAHGAYDRLMDSLFGTQPCFEGFKDDEFRPALVFSFLFDPERHYHITGSFVSAGYGKISAKLDFERSNKRAEDGRIPVDLHLWRELMSHQNIPGTKAAREAHSFQSVVEKTTRLVQTSARETVLSNDIGAICRVPGAALHDQYYRRQLQYHLATPHLQQYGVPASAWHMPVTKSDASDAALINQASLRHFLAEGRRLMAPEVMGTLATLYDVRQRNGNPVTLRPERREALRVA